MKNFVILVFTLVFVEQKHIGKIVLKNFEER